MPDLSATELLLAITSALGVGGTAAGVAKGRGTPADHEDRISKLERADRECSESLAHVGERLTTLESRMTRTEIAMAEAVGRFRESMDNFRESTDRMWKATDKLTESVDELRADVIKVVVEHSVDREMRRKDK